RPQHGRCGVQHTGRHTCEEEGNEQTLFHGKTFRGSTNIRRNFRRRFVIMKFRTLFALHASRKFYPLFPVLPASPPAPARQTLPIGPLRTSIIFRTSFSEPSSEPPEKADAPQHSRLYKVASASCSRMRRPGRPLHSGRA